MVALSQAAPSVCCRDDGKSCRLSVGVGDDVNRLLSRCSFWHPAGYHQFDYLLFEVLADCTDCITLGWEKQEGCGQCMSDCGPEAVEGHVG